MKRKADGYDANETTYDEGIGSGDLSVSQADRPVKDSATCVPSDGSLATESPKRTWINSPWATDLMQ